MTTYTTVKHPIQKAILEQLTQQEHLRFRDLKPADVTASHLTYHLNILIKLGMVQKVEKTYTLAPKGQSYVDRLASSEPQVRPKVVIMLLIQNSNGDVLLQKRRKQPYINTWTLPYGKKLVGDGLVESTGARIAKERLGIIGQDIRHAGICYIHTLHNKRVVSSTLVHLCRFNQDNITIDDTVRWFRPHKLSQNLLAPAVEAIIARGFFNDPFFYEEFIVDWQP